MILPVDQGEPLLFDLIFDHHFHRLGESDDPVERRLHVVSHMPLLLRIFRLSGQDTE